MERSAFAAVPLLGLVVWNFHPEPRAPEPANPWEVPAPTAGDQMASLLDGIGQRFGVGTAKAAGGEEQSAAAAYQKARISEIYASHDYHQQATAKALGTDAAGLRRLLRRYGIIEWPEGHKAG
jgi:DNA-binding NtrC family response regulator